VNIALVDEQEEALCFIFCACQFQDYLMNIRRSLCVVFLFSSLISCGVFAREIKGKVKDSMGTPAKGAIVAFSDSVHDAVLTRTNDKGEFDVQNLPEGTYGVTATTSLGAVFLRQLAIQTSTTPVSIALTLDKASVPLEGLIRISAKGKLPPDLRIFASRIGNEIGDRFYADFTEKKYGLSVLPGLYVIFAKSKDWNGQTGLIHIPGRASPIDLTILREVGGNPKLSDEILAMEKADQDARHFLIDHPNDSDALAGEAAVDAKNLPRISQIIHDYGWPGPDLVGRSASEAFWVLVQHGPASLLSQCLPFMKQAAERGELPLQDLALSVDRDLVSKGKKQIYGSQVHEIGASGEVETYPIDDEAHVDQRRADMGMGTLAEYKAMLIQTYAPHQKN
jgi:hypothetical protein